MHYSKLLLCTIILYMQFHTKEVIWAKVKGYPWWPAEINKLPDDKQANFKVVFFAEETYAMLQPKCVQKFAESYAQHSKTKTKKFVRALQLANCAANRTNSQGKTKKQVSKRRKQQDQQSQNSQSLSIQDSPSLNREIESSMIDENQQTLLVENQVEEIDRKKVDKIQNQLSQIIIDLQNCRNKEWRYSTYFQNFNRDYNPNSQELLHSNLTRKIRFIIDCSIKAKVEQKQIQKLQQLSELLKKKVINYLTDTSYYDHHIKLIDRSKQNRVQVQSQINKIIRRKYDKLIKRQFISLLASHVGNEVGKKSKFKCKQLIAQLKQGVYDESIRTINSKAATQRVGDFILTKYQ